MSRVCSAQQQHKKQESKPFLLPSSLPRWPKGQGFATGTINLGELEVKMVKDFQLLSTYTPQKGCGVTFYKPVLKPADDGFFTLGHYCQPTHQQHTTYVLVARDTRQQTALKLPLCYRLIWSSGIVYVWRPIPPVGYRALGFVVTVYEDNDTIPFPDREQEQVMCVRHDLTECCDVVLDDEFLSSASSLIVGNPKPKPCHAGVLSRAVTVGAFYCTTISDIFKSDLLIISCLTNLNTTLEAMPTLEQVESLIQHYGPTVYFHPDEAYLPSSVSWFFNNGVLLFKKGNSDGIPVKTCFSNLPQGRKNDGEFWLDIPLGDDSFVKYGNLESAKLYVHVKPALGGTFTDIAMWFFCPFKGPETFALTKILNLNVEDGKHLGDWEHFTLRLNNFDGELCSVYFSEYNGGEWVPASSLEYIQGNKPIVYSSKYGHSTFPKAGTYIEGSMKLLGIGVKNDVAKSDRFIDSSKKYQIIAAEYLGGVVVEPGWLQYMRDWGPRVLYDGNSKLEKIISHVPFFILLTVGRLINNLFPLGFAKGLTGPKAKASWYGDEDHKVPLGLQ